MTLAESSQKRVAEQTPGSAHHPQRRIFHPAAHDHDALWRSFYIDQLSSRRPFVFLPGRRTSFSPMHATDTAEDKRFPVYWLCSLNLVNGVYRQQAENRFLGRYRSERILKCIETMKSQLTRRLRGRRIVPERCREGSGQTTRMEAGGPHSDVKGNSSP